VIKIKGRPTGKGTPFSLPPDHDPADYIVLSDQARELIKAHWPGPLNVIGIRQLTSPVSRQCETDGSQAVRQSSHPIAAELARLLDRPIVATSANRADQPSIYSFAEAEAEFSTGRYPDAIIDAGDLPVVPASTTVKIVDDKIEVVRQGEIEIPTHFT
jgi:L-threonylcarbamoyladenylate synthase